MAEEKAPKSGPLRRWRERRRATAVRSDETRRRARQQLAADERRSPAGPPIIRP
jgi:hypothetical protein